MDDDNKFATQMPTNDEESNPSNEDGKNGNQALNNSTISQGSQVENNDYYPGNVKSGEEISADRLNKITGLLESIDNVGNIPEKKGYC